MTRKKSDLSLYDLFAARFVGMNEAQIRTLISYDERVRNPDMYSKLDTDSFKSWQEARHTFCRELGLMGVNERTVPVCFAYYIEYCRVKGHDHTRKLWLLIYNAYNAAEFIRTCLDLHAYSYLLKCFPDLDAHTMRRVMQECCERIGKNGAGNGYFWMAIQAAQKLGEQKVLNRLYRMAFDKGEAALAFEVAKVRGAPLTETEMRLVCRARIKEIGRTGSVTADELEFFAKHRESFGPPIVQIMIEVAEAGDYPEGRLGYAFLAAEKLDYRFTKRDLMRMWKVATGLKEYFGAMRLRILRPLKKLDKRFEATYREELKKNLEYNKRSSKVEQVLETAKEMGHELTSRDWFERFMSNDFEPSETLELLAKSLASESGTDRFIHESRVEGPFLQTH